LHGDGRAHPPLAALRGFAAVARHGSFVRAAATLNVSTSAVSHQIHTLEDGLGATLLTRARNGASRTAVTAEGTELLGAIDAAFAQLGAACEAVRERARRTRPVLAISAGHSVASLWLAPLLAAFAAPYPSVQWKRRTPRQWHYGPGHDTNFKTVWAAVSGITNEDLPSNLSPVDALWAAKHPTTGREFWLPVRVLNAPIASTSFHSASSHGERMKASSP
jgi:molybdenum-dependent DNA-binding transcriptional regulator ModE